MNMQPITFVKIREVQNRYDLLNDLVRTASLNMSDKRLIYTQKKQVATQNKMTVAEYLALYPSLDTSAIDAKIAAATTAYNQEVSRYNALKTDAERIANWKFMNGKKVELDFLTAHKSRMVADYNAAKANPRHALAGDQYDALHPFVDAVECASELTAISVAGAEQRKLLAFLASGPNPKAGNYDVDLLTGTAVSYP